MAQRYSVQLDAHPENDGRWGTISGKVTPRAYRVELLVFSHDERWYAQKPAITNADGTFKTEVAFGLEPISDQGREYIVLALVGPPLAHEGIYGSLNDLPAGTSLAGAGILSVSRSDLQIPPPGTL
jgi:hypothetical protein